MRKFMLDDHNDKFIVVIESHKACLPWMAKQLRGIIKLFHHSQL
uniref:Uncharacterized protein n=1 Tax=Rhizophora mucronata TaxID=61149 RepID=A0A2P2NRJ0_RHIMU